MGDNTNPSDDPLQALVVDAVSLDRAAIAAALSGYVAVDETSGEVVTRPAFKALPQPKQLVAFLLGAKAAVLLGAGRGEGRSPAEVTKGTGVPSGTVRRVLRELVEKRVISQDSSGMYFIAHHQVATAIEAISGSPAAGGSRHGSR